MTRYTAAKCTSWGVRCTRQGLQHCQAFFFCSCSSVKRHRTVLQQSANKSIGIVSKHPLRSPDCPVHSHKMVANKTCVPSWWTWRQRLAHLGSLTSIVSEYENYLSATMPEAILGAAPRGQPPVRKLLSWTAWPRATGTRQQPFD